MADKYILKVTAGTAYDPSKHSPVLVNTSSPLAITSPQISASLNVRIRDYRGLPKNSPPSSPYFTHEPHKSDRISIAFSFALKEESLSGEELVFGNDFDHPIRDRLPWGFSTAFQFIKSWVDPGLFGDPYADEPYLYGPLLSSINILRIGEKGTEEDGKVVKGKGSGEEEEEVLTEGADGDGEEKRKESGMPADAAGRKKYFLQKEHREKFRFEEGREYRCDFFNPYLDFNDFTLKLPVITIPVISHWDGQPLRYVLKSRNSETPLLVILFSLLPMEQAEADAKPHDTAAKPKESETTKADDDDEVD